ncbi:MAG: hypothetical protein GWN58_21600, partial [Anaerolineae bacterium]|nr:hypothetical protein [Anaerolineae bacterium]
SRELTGQRPELEAGEGEEMVTSTTRVKDNVSIIDLDGKLIAGDAFGIYDAVQGLTSKGVSAILINLDGVD